MHQKTEQQQNSIVRYQKLILQTSNFDELDPVFGLSPATEGGFEFSLNRGDIPPLLGEEGLEFDRLLIINVRT